MSTKKTKETSIFPKDLIRQLVKENGIKSIEDVSELVKELTKDAIQEALEAELDEELGYSKYDSKNKAGKNSRNGHSKKIVNSKNGRIELEIPREREGTFEPQIVKKHQRDISKIEDQILSMYSVGMSDRDIQKNLEDIYGVDLSPDKISRITDKIIPFIHEWQNRPLEKIYTIIFLDAMHFNVREDGRVIKKAVYVIMGYTVDGYKDILGFWLGKNESSRYWLTIINELKNRGVEEILIACVDGLPGFVEAIHTVYPQTEVQRCIVHQIRYSCKYVNYKERKHFTQDMKEIYHAQTEEMGKIALEKFSDKWNDKYPYAIRSWEDNWTELSTFFKYPDEIRKLIYTTNPIESFNSMVKRNTNKKSSFPSDMALSKMLYLSTQNILRKWNQKRNNWNLIINQLLIYFKERLEKYL